MTKKQVAKLRHGLYRIFWKSGGESLASVGSTHNGLRWLAQTNWTGAAAHGVASSGHWRQVKSVTPIIVQLPDGAWRTPGVEP